MKTSIVPIACGTALAVMAGAATAHWCSVRDMVQLASVLPPVREAGPAKPAPLPDERVTREAMDFLAAEGRGRKPSAERKAPGGQAVTASASPGDADARIERLLGLLESTVSQNQEMRDRIADTNRDLMELQFRVDMYDGEFRPLKVEEEAPAAGDFGFGAEGVLPPIE